jgi:hypothetical protein
MQENMYSIYVPVLRTPYRVLRTVSHHRSRLAWRPCTIPHSPDGRLAAFPRGDHSAHTTGDGGKKGEKKLAVPPVMD